MDENVNRDDDPMEFEEVIPSGEIRIPVHSKTTNKTGHVAFGPFGGDLLRAFRKINGGNGNPKKARPLAANNYLVDNCYLRTEGIRIPFERAGYKDEKSFFKQDKKGQLFMDIVLGRYLSEVLPDTDDLND